MITRRRSTTVCVLLVALVAAWACGTSTDSAGAPAPPAFAVGSQAKMNGLKDGIVVPVLNVWNTVPPSEAVCTLQHATAVTVTDTKYNPGDKHWYLQIDSGHGCTGWVPETSLSK